MKKLDRTARVKIESETVDLVNSIVKIIFDSYPDSLAAPLLPSNNGGIHTFITVREGQP